MKKQEVTNLIKETIENKLFEHKLKQQISTIYESREDLQSAMLLSMMEELSGKKIPDPTVLDEGVWEKAKAMLAKIRLSKSTGAAKQRDALEDAANNAANKKFSEMFGELKKMDGFGEYPNNESEQEFVGITTAIGLIYEAVKEAHQNGMLETETANNLISKLKGYADGLEGDLSYSYRYFNEDEDADGGDVLDEEGEQLNERAATNYNRAINLMKYVQDTPVADLKPRKLRALLRIRRGLEKELARRTKKNGADGILGMTNKEQDLLSKFASQDAMFRKKGLDAIKIPDEAKGAIDAIKKGGLPGAAVPDAAAGGGGGGGGGAAPDASPDELGPELGPEMDPEMEDEFGNYSDDGSLPPGVGSGGGGTSLGDISGITSLPKLYAKAGSMATLNSWMGGPFLGQLAAFALPAAAIAGVAGLVGKRLMGKSREGSLKKLSGMMAPVDPSEQGTDSPAPTGADPASDPASDPEFKKGMEMGKNLEKGKGTGNEIPDPGPTPGVAGAVKKGVDQLKGLKDDPTLGGMQPGTPDLDSMPEPDEEEEEERRRRLDAMQEVKRWQKIAGIIKG